MSKCLGKWLLGISACLASFACVATLPRTNLCYDVLCLSIVEGSPDLVKDRTYQQSANGTRLLIVRFIDGAYLSVLVRPVLESECPKTPEQELASLISQSKTTIASRGCLVAPQANRFFQVDFKLSSPKIPVQRQLYVLDPYVRISGITNIKYWSGPTYDSNTLMLQPSRHKP
jgi:hypothetical protein